jgi:putative CocE/NonD family hydrolase
MGSVLTIMVAALGTARSGEAVQHYQTAANPVAQWGIASEVDDSPEVMVRMRDGIRLSTDVLLPKEIAPPYPTVLVRLPYPKVSAFSGESNAMLRLLVDNGYAIVVQFERGTHASEGEYHFLSGARHDGYDTISWIVSQPWSNGRVGTYGCSSGAENQMALSAENHPAHKAMIAQGAGAGIGDFPGVSSQGLFYSGGVPAMEFTPWYYNWGYIHRPQLPQSVPDEERSRLMQIYGMKTGELALPLLPAAAHLPSKDILRAIGTPPTDWDTFIQRAPGDLAWKREQFLTANDHPRVPALFVDSWHDIGAYEVVKAFEYQQNQAPDQFLIMGPTGHCQMGTETKHTMVGERDVGDARYAYNDRYLQWFDYWLKDKKNEALSRPKIEYYLSGSSQWRSASAWPPAATERKLYLNSTIGANSSRGDGSLDTELPRRAGSDTYRYDPVDPVPTLSRFFDKSVVTEQKPVADRQDVLVYTSSPLTKDLDIVGEVTATVYLSASVRDTDLMLRLVDVDPDGKAYNVGDENLRLRYRKSFASPELMSPGAVYPVALKGIVTATRFSAGHRIRIQVTSSNFPLFERNLNTGNVNSSEIISVVAETRVYHGATRASYLSLPVVSN